MGEIYNRTLDDLIGKQRSSDQKNKIHTILESTQTRDLRFTCVWVRYKIGSLIIIFMFEDAIMVS